MTALLCRLGLHRAAWQPTLAAPITDPGAIQASGWVHLRRCVRCGHLIGKRLR